MRPFDSHPNTVAAASDAIGHGKTRSVKRRGYQTARCQHYSSKHRLEHSRSAKYHTDELLASIVAYNHYRRAVTPPVPSAGISTGLTGFVGSSVASFSAMSSANGVSLPSISALPDASCAGVISALCFAFLFLNQKYNPMQSTSTARTDTTTPAIAPLDRPPGFLDSSGVEEKVDVGVGLRDDAGNVDVEEES